MQAMLTTALVIALAIQLILSGAAVFGMWIGARLPEKHLSNETKTIVSTSMAVVGTIAALVISLLISSGSTRFTARSADVATLAGEIVRLDTLLDRYGPQAGTARDALHRYAELKEEQLFPRGRDARSRLDAAASLGALIDLQDQVLALKPGDRREQWLSDQALQMTAALDETRLRLSQDNEISVPLPFLGALVLWLFVLFASFGLFAPRHATTLIALLLTAFAISSAIKLILDLDTPVDGHIRLTGAPIHISDDPMRRALETTHH